MKSENKIVEQLQKESLIKEIEKLKTSRKEDSELLEIKKQKFAQELIESGMIKQESKIKAFLKKILNTVL